MVYIHRVKGLYSRGVQEGGGYSMGGGGYSRPPGARGGRQMAPLSTHKTPEPSR